MSTDGRPRLAVGHVSLEVEDVGDACAFFVRYGMRDIFKERQLREFSSCAGGTHLVLSRAKAPIEPGREAPFDLMVDDIDEARAEFTSAGVTATADHARTNPRHLPRRRSERVPIRGDLFPRGRPRGLICRGGQQGRTDFMTDNG